MRCGRPVRCRAHDAVPLFRHEARLSGSEGVWCKFVAVSETSSRPEGRRAKKTGDAAFQQAKADVEARVAELDRTVKALQSKIKAGTD